MTEKSQLPFDVLQLILNIFGEDDERNNLAIFSGYAVDAVKQYRILVETRKKLLKINMKIQFNKMLVS